MPERPLALNTFISASGYHESGWRVLDDDPRDVLTIEHFAQTARIAERAGFDSVFLADSPGNFGNFPHPPHAERYERAQAYVQRAERAWDEWGSGRPVLVKAGSSPAGIDLAART
jgi:alkanesulfonate monooxygenase SsuD/methylene tetrahydromethanopterin reductase-like flavin-dependent oxidoreductase (luciferase family)